jgi:zinc transport system ATP-binding protein
VPEAAIKITDMSFAYQAAPVLEHVNLAIETGDFSSIVGPNGGGKTTLLKLMLGLLQPTSGTVRIFGEPPERSRTRIGYVPQHHGFDIYFPVRVLDVVLMGRLQPGGRLGPFSRADKKIARRVLGEIGLGNLEKRPFASLSGGQRQRTLIARSLASNPELLLLDEPTAHVDVVAAGELNSLLQELNKRVTIVMVSHDLGFVSHPIKNVICVNRKVVSHSAADITGDMISDVYGHEVHMVEHGHHLHGEEHG